MQQLLYVLPALACPVGMGAMMWMMMRPKKQDHGPALSQEQDLAQLRAEIAALRAGRPQGACADAGIRLDKSAGVTP
jgi:hypothetical protein